MDGHGQSVIVRYLNRFCNGVGGESAMIALRLCRWRPCRGPGVAGDRGAAEVESVAEAAD